ncbi:hypothetical protein [Lactobacillus hominis]|uniref:Uncharacterized protein n=1 Tax=Lactobacillus hominis DSM 23910 = CRBIP 24.179 TaxID=1423758 RepID=I7IVL0_9LACO|nr:hypothetical protein [Lactobacillus hominis]MCT3348937.1 hypothetical protein [Lactobacillus hominis]CCI81628.1 Protein of unknown function [Lactobacillus hominis DSM 23910 = CRBIP 24.179]
MNRRQQVKLLKADFQKFYDRYGSSHMFKLAETRKSKGKSGQALFTEVCIFLCFINKNHSLSIDLPAHLPGGRPILKPMLRKNKPKVGLLNILKSKLTSWLQ